MTDGVKKGTGNSRYLKTVSNFLTLYSTYEKFAQAFMAGTIPVDFNGINAAGWTTQGTPLNKANLLKDATATGMGLTASATPDQAFAKLRSLIAAAQNIAEGRGIVVTGTYVGASGADSVTLEFVSPPKLVAIGTKASYCGPLILVRGVEEAATCQYSKGISKSEFMVRSVTWEANFVRFKPLSASAMNMTGYTYHYTAIL